jgi:membrane protein
MLRVLTVAVHEFFRDQCMLRASALTFYTLLSIVPVLAVIFGIAKGFGLEKILERELLEQLSGQEQTLKHILTFAHNMLENTKGGLIAGVGVAVMFWSAIKVLGQIESALNAMWEVVKSRSWSRRFSDYLSIMLLAPLLFLVAGSASVFVRTQFDAVASRFEIIGLLGPLLVCALKLTPIVLVWALFALIYMVIPNTRVPFSAAAVGAAAGSFFYQLVQWIYIDLQVGMTRQNAIYGSFAALPLLLAWIQISWTIVLFGAELCYAVQHRGEFCGPAGRPVPSPAERKLIGMLIVRKAIAHFTQGEPALTARQLTLATGIPLPLVQRAANDLVSAGILSMTSSHAQDEAAFQPAMDIQLLDLQRVSIALETAADSTTPFKLPDDPGLAALRNALRQLSQAAAESPANRLLRDI